MRPGSGRSASHAPPFCAASSPWTGRSIRVPGACWSLLVVLSFSPFDQTASVFACAIMAARTATAAADTRARRKSCARRQDVALYAIAAMDSDPHAEDEREARSSRSLTEPA